MLLPNLNLDSPLSITDSTVGVLHFLCSLCAIDLAVAQHQWEVIYFLRVIKCLLDHFFQGKCENVADKLKEHSMTKPIPRIGGNITNEARAKPP